MRLSFLTRANVYDLARIVDELDIPVMAFGLKMIFRTISLKVLNISCFCLIRLMRLRPFVIIAREKPNHGPSYGGWEASL